MAKLFFRFGAMGCGKSLALMGVAHNYQRIGQKVAIFTSSLDSRNGSGSVGSRLGVSLPALCFNRDTVFEREALADVLDGVSCVLVDEAQFLSVRQVCDLHRLAALHGIPVICYGLRADFRGEPFEGSARLCLIADVLEELRMVCECGKRATFNARFDADGNRVVDGEQVLIGDSQYRALCPSCFYGGAVGVHHVRND
jgi:thymidine kinase